MFTKAQLADVINAIGDHVDILCVSHVGPDGDAVGSLLGMGWMLKALGRRPTLALQDRVPDNLTALPGAESIIGPDAVSELPEIEAFCRFRNYGTFLMRKQGEGQENYKVQQVLTGT